MIDRDRTAPPADIALPGLAASLRASAASEWARAGDVAVAALDGEGHTVASDGPAWHAAACDRVMAGVFERFGDGLADGDLVIHNDPYTGGTALVDLSVVAASGVGAERRYGIARMRIADVGGGEPGGVFPNARQVIQEGDRVPAVRIAERGRMLPDLVRRLAINTRRRSAYEHDLEALARSADAAARLRPNAGEVGAEEVTREAWDIRGRGAADVSVRGDLLREPRRLAVRISATETGLEVDFSGTGPSDPGPGNIPWAVTMAAAIEAIHASIGGTESLRSVAERITWSADVGCLVRPAFPAACSGGGLYSGFAVRHVVARALEAMGMPAIAYPTWRGGAVLCGPPAAEYETLVALDCPGVFERLPDSVAGVKTETVNVERWGREVLISGPSGAGSRLTAWRMEIEGEGPAPYQPAQARADLPASVWLSSGLR
jgi:N-methylhydantoinase B